MTIQEQLRAYSDHIVERVDAEDVVDRPVTVTPYPPARRGWLVAVAAAAIVVVAGVALTVWGPSGGTAPVTEETSTTLDQANPDSLPPLDTWTWQRVDGDDANLPGASQVVLVDGEFVATEPAPCRIGTGGEPICEDPHEVWWRSEDGLTWHQEPLDAAFIDAVLAPGRGRERTWVIADPTTPGAAPELFWLVDGAVRPVSLDGDEIESLDVPVIRGDTVVVPGVTASGPALWVSNDAGAAFTGVTAPWSSGTLTALVGAPESFVAYVDVGSPGAVLIEAWTSPDGRSWEQVRPVAFASKPIGWVEVYGDRGPYLATVVDTEGAVGALWFSEDGLTWSQPEGLPPVTDPGTESFFESGFGFVFLTFAPPADQSGDDLIRVLVSADGLTWEDASDPGLRVSSEPPGDATGSNLAWSVAGDRVFIIHGWDSGERTLWVGGFED